MSLWEYTQLVSWLTQVSRDGFVVPPADHKLKSAAYGGLSATPAEIMDRLLEDLSGQGIDDMFSELDIGDEGEVDPNDLVGLPLQQLLKTLADHVDIEDAAVL